MLYPKLSSPLKCHCGKDFDHSVLRGLADTSLDCWFELVREVAERQGFELIFPGIPANNVIWLCPWCRGRAEKMVEELISAVGIAGDFVGYSMDKPIPVSQFIQLDQLSQAFP